MTGVASKHPPKRPRADWYAQVARLRAQDLTGTEIARRLGISSQFVYQLLNDPDGSKDRKRKQRYQGVCVDCGGPTQGSDGYGKKASTRCAACAAEDQHAQKYWTRERIIAAIRRYAREHGRPPLSSDWARKPPPGYPFASQVYRQARNGKRHNPFGSWAEAIEAAGFPRPRVGGWVRTDQAGLHESSRLILQLARRRPRNGLTAPQLATERGTTISAAYRTLRMLERRGLLVRDGKQGKADIYRIAR